VLTLGTQFANIATIRGRISEIIVGTVWVAVRCLVRWPIDFCVCPMSNLAVTSPAAQVAFVAGSAQLQGIRSVRELMVSRGGKALALLVEVHDYGQALGGNAWDFALDLRALCRAGLSIADLRWLLCQRLLEHGLEITQPGAARRSFRPAGAIAFRKASCFVLTPAGANFVRNGALCDNLSSRAVAIQPTLSATSAATIPTWDETRLELRFIGKVVKRYFAPAPNQQRILAAFDEEGWPVHIDDPLSPQIGQDPKRRLHDTINSLNRHQVQPLLRFLGDGKGEGVRWAPASDSRSQHAQVDRAVRRISIAPV
jgi:hypothetical protein